MVVINGSVYKLSINIQESVIDDCEDDAINEINDRLRKAGFKEVEIEVYDSEPNIEDLD
jgi:ABC-type uncharacterized transport system substrate-binding protein